MILVASSLRNTQLSPKFTRTTKAAHQNVNDNINEEGDYEETSTHRRSVDEQLQSICNVNSRRSIHETTDLQQQSKNILSNISTKSISIIKQNSMSISFVLYIALGTLFYTFVGDTNDIRSSHGFYQALSIGYSVGLSPRNASYQPSPWFSSFYIILGAILIAIILTGLGNKIEERSSLQMFDALSRREDYEELIKEGQRIDVRCLAFIKYYFVYLLIVLLWVVWLVVIILWSMHGIKEWNFDKAQYFAFSLCSSAGSLSLPDNSPEYTYLLAAISMLIGVPLMAMAISAIVVMIWQGHNYRKIKRAAWDAVLTEELRLLDELDVGAVEEGGERITKSGYILLGLLRMGQDGGIIKYLANAYDEHDQRGGVLVDFGGETTTRAANDTPSHLSSLAAAYVSSDSTSASRRQSPSFTTSAVYSQAITVSSMDKDRNSSQAWSTTGSTAESVDMSSSRKVITPHSSLVGDTGQQVVVKMESITESSSKVGRNNNGDDDIEMSIQTDKT